ncbi:hypothetical protein HNQ36_003312 [Afipia massiliensis]|uniref:Uncharacterized protein n=1 Tax=Afipia massiliensis TaxID=211460 RepID=A0A840N6C2_9BRAD|nr:hypothetical protein [Afipia massiliensis]MBB5053321.1 hypothetical protein [Afipia massiliensis]
MRTAIATLFTVIALTTSGVALEVNLGTEAEGTSYVIDTTTIGVRSYRTGAVVGAIAPRDKDYREVWATRKNKKGEIESQLLWVFDCQSRAAELAEANTLDSSKNRDVTARAQAGGIERYMVRIPPKSYFDHAERVVCKKR